MDIPEGTMQRAAWLGAHVGSLTPEQAQAIVPNLWVRLKRPDDHLDCDVWRRAFALAGFTHNGEPADPPWFGATLFRGATSLRAYRWSWTSEVSTAVRFASSGSSRARVWVVFAPANHLLASWSGRGESEFVVDTEGLNIQEYATSVQPQRHAGRAAIGPLFI